MDVADDCGFKDVLHDYWNDGNYLLPFVDILFQLPFKPIFNVAFHWGDVDLIPNFYVEKCNDPKTLCKDHHCFGVYLKLFPSCGISSNNLLIYLFRCV
jgi:hypothetical protein